MTNLLYNGGFDGNLYRWAPLGAAVIDRANGYPRAGCASLPAGGSVVSETVGLGENYLYTVHFFYQLATGATLTASYGSISRAYSGLPAGVWREGILSFALDAGAQSSVLFMASGGACLVDSVALLQGGLAISRAAIAVAVAARIAALVSDASLSAVASASGSEGDYTLAINEALRALGAVNGWGDPDVTMLESSKVNDVIDAAQDALLVGLQARAVLVSDVTLGPRSEKRSQIAGLIGDMRGGGKGGGGRITMSELKNRDWPR